MTTLLLSSAIYGGPNNHGRSGHRHLLDRFWDAVHLDSPESPSNDSVFFYSKVEGYDDPSTPEIFARFGATPTIDVRSALNSPTSLPPQAGCLPPAIFAQPPQTVSSSPLCTAVEHTKRKLWSRSTSKSTSRWPKLSIPLDLKPRQPGISSPATAVLAMASNFLDDIVKLTRAHSPTATTTFIGSPEGDVEIMDSDVQVNVIDDSRRAVDTGTSEWPCDYPLEKLEIPPMTAVCSPSTAFDFQSPYTIDGSTENARGLDAMSHMDRERQLSKSNGPLWH